MDAHIKQEITEATRSLPDTNLCRAVISLSSINSNYSGSTLGGSGDGESNVEHHPKMKQRIEAVFPVGFIDPIRPAERLSFENRTVAPSTYSNGGPSDNITVRVKKEIVEYTAEMEKRTEEAVTTVSLTPSCRQFWKAGDYYGSADSSNFSDDHLRVHPKFLHSNATSHKWALGALAELLDNALDEYCNGATYVHVDDLENLKDKSKMVMVQDNGGGMTPDKMRQCMSLGYSEKGKMANTIGQCYTMRLGADVIVFSRCQGKHGRTSTQSIGLLSFTFLRRTGKEDIVVPMVDYEKKGATWCKYAKFSTDSWQRNLETIVLWSPYESEEHLLQQFDLINEQGTRIIIYNLWEDEEGLQELDFDTDSHDIHVRGDDRDYKKIESAKNISSCRHFLTYRHSLRSYASILYYRIPPGFRIILRGKDVEHHNMVNDLILTNEHVYKPAAYANVNDPNMSAKVTLGFIRDAIHHFDVQGFNVYHKNRLIKPFWRVWNAAGSVLEANFVEPAHDKQGFERTAALSRLETRLQHFKKIYWSSNCQLVGYAQRRRANKYIENSNRGTFRSTGNIEHPSSHVKKEHEAESVSRNIPALRSVQLQSSLYEVAPNLELRDLKAEREKNNTLENQIDCKKKMIAKMDDEQQIFVSVFSEERGRREQEEENLKKRLEDANETIKKLLNRVKTLEATRKLH